MSTDMTPRSALQMNTLFPLCGAVCTAVTSYFREYWNIKWMLLTLKRSTLRGNIYSKSKGYLSTENIIYALRIASSVKVAFLMCMDWWRCWSRPTYSMCSYRKMEFVIICVFFHKFVNVILHGSVSLRIASCREQKLYVSGGRRHR